MRATAGILFLLALGVSCSSGGGGSPVEVVAITLDQGGGTIQVTEGDLEGASLTVPPGGVTESTVVRVLQGFALSHPGFRPVSRGVIFEPGMALNGEPALTLPIASNAVSVPDVVILHIDGSDVFELGDGTINLATEQVTATIPEFGTYYAGERLFNGYVTELDGSRSDEDFLPLNDGDTWQFDSGITVSMEETSSEPNLGGANVFKLTFATADESLGFYLQRAATNTGPDPTQMVGFFSTTDGASFQRTHAPRSLLPAKVTPRSPPS